MTSVAVLGASGMLGGAVLDVLAATPGLQVIGTVRSPSLLAASSALIPAVEWRLLDADGGVESIEAAIAGASWVVNAIGLTKPFIHDDNPVEVENAVRVNAQFPFSLAGAAQRGGSQVIQIATDCVYSGSTGRYSEHVPHDALDVYGKTKSLGEVPLPHVHLLRCSIIGPQGAGTAYLLEWLRRQPAHAEVRGYTDHHWNGVTTLAFGRLCRALVTGAVTPTRLQHVVPADDISKAELLVALAHALGRTDIAVRPGPAPSAVDRTLRTDLPEANAALWAGAGYAAPPKVAEMVAELGVFSPPFVERPR